jgi:hypothetical protein
MAETQRPINAGEIGPLHGVFQILWRGPDGHLYVHQMRGPDVRALLLNDPEGRHLRDSLFWHMKASFLSVGAAVFGFEPVELEPEPVKPSPIVGPDGRAYNSTDGNGGTGGGAQSN